MVVTFHQSARGAKRISSSPSLRFRKGQVAPLLPQGQGLITGRQTCVRVPRHMGGGQGCRDLLSLYLHAQWPNESLEGSLALVSTGHRRACCSASTPLSDARPPLVGLRPAVTAQVPPDETAATPSVGTRPTSTDSGRLPGGHLVTRRAQLLVTRLWLAGTCAKKSRHQGQHTLSVDPNRHQQTP